MKPMAQEETLAHIQETFGARDAVMRDLLTFVLQSVTQTNRSDSERLHTELRNSPQRGNLLMQDFLGALHLHSIHVDNGDTSLATPILPDEIKEATMGIDGTSLSLPPDIQILFTIIEWAKLRMGIDLRVALAGEVIRLGVEKEQAIGLPPGSTAEGRLLAVAAEREQVLAEIVAFISQDDYRAEDDEIVIPRKYLRQLIDAKNEHSANSKFMYSYGTCPCIDYHQVKNIDASDADRRSKFYRLSDAIVIITDILDHNRLRVNYSEHYPRPEKAIATRFNDDVIEIRNVPQKEFQKYCGIVIEQIGKLGLEFSADDERRIVRTIAPALLVTDSILYLSLQTIHDLILHCVNKAAPFDRSYSDSLVDVREKGKIRAASTQKAFLLSTALKYIHAGSHDQRVGLQWHR